MVYITNNTKETEALGQALAEKLEKTELRCVLKTVVKSATEQWNGLGLPQLPHRESQTDSGEPPAASLS